MMKELGLFIYTETSLHAGTGSTVSAVDLPIQRERTTRHPLVQGSGVKGAMRMQTGGQKTAEFIATFGPDTDKAEEHAAALSVGDARIVLFPVQSLAGVFAYATCPMVLARIRRNLPKFPAFSGSITSQNGLTTTKSDVTIGNQMVLEEFSFSTTPNKEVDAIANWLVKNALPQTPEYDYWQKKLPTSLVVLSDEDFTEFTVNSTEIVTRIKIDSAKKTVAQGALWTQESLPSDTLLMSAITIVDSRDGQRISANNVANWLASNLPARIQIGGDETTGQGFVAVRISEG
ncbi:MAG: type III-B CRISPR module RAMP protein Cmr4 [bacterium]|nr:type III-B CRISPR module RAMP protein Cmr4 [bacterium]